MLSSLPWVIFEYNLLYFNNINFYFEFVKVSTHSVSCIIFWRLLKISTLYLSYIFRKYPFSFHIPLTYIKYLFSSLFYLASFFILQRPVTYPIVRFLIENVLILLKTPLKLYMTRNQHFRFRSKGFSYKR